MLQKYTFIPVISFLLLGLAFWSTRMTPTLSFSDGALVLEEASSVSLPRQSELVETLDRIVAYEHYYFSVYGHFTKLLNRIGYKPPRNLSESYDIRVVEATNDRLLVTAFSEVNGKTRDLASIDQGYRIHATFAVPKPRPEYLKVVAFKHLRLLRNALAGGNSSEESVFKGYFRYSVTTDSKNERVASAVGLRSPVEKVELELNSQKDLGLVWHSDSSLPSGGYADGLRLDDDERTLGYESPHTGQNAAEATDNLQEEAYLAQKIFHGEVGRYAKTWSELSQIAQFHFEGREGADALMSPQDGQPLIRAPSRNITSISSQTPLEIERISPDELPSRVHP